MPQPTLLHYDLHPDVVSFSTMRQGGVSTGNYAEFNINHYCGDDEESVRKNRAALCQLLNIDDQHLVMPHQVHQTEVAHIDQTFFSLTTEEKAQHLEGIDAVTTHLPHVCIGVSTADCIPLLIYDSRQHVACAIHAGWRGTVKRIAEKTIADMASTYGTRPEDLKAQIGLGISLDSFEVGDEVYDAFSAAGFHMNIISQKYPGNAGSKWHINLPECNRQQLLSAGIPASSIAIADICTVKHAHTFFSARRLGIQSGRIFTGIIM
jgi:hypothetical protein